MPPDTEPALLQCDPRCSGSNDEVTDLDCLQLIIMEIILIMIVRSPRSRGSPTSCLRSEVVAGMAKL